VDRERLLGWKQIASFLGRDARTAQRWERVRALPVHRLPGGDSSTVFAYRNELDAWQAGKLQPTGSTVQSIAPGLLVLPLDYHAPDRSMAFVADGLAQELIGRLATVPLASLRVLSWTTAKAYHASAMHARALASELGVRYLVEGSIVAAMERWIIDLRVVDAMRDEVVLAQRFGCAGREILLLQSEIATAIATHLSLHLAGELIDPMWTREVDPRTFLTFLDGVRHHARGEQRGNAVAIERFDEALRLDPRFVPARVHKGLTLMYSDRSTGWLRDDVQREVRAIAAACAEEGGHLVSYALLDGLLGRNDCEWERIDRRLRNTVAANPSSVALRHHHAFNLTLLRKFDDANAILLPVAGLDRSLESDRQSAGTRLWSRDFAGAIELFDGIVRREPAHTYANLMRFMAAVYTRDQPLVRRYYREMHPPLRRKYLPFVTGCMAAVEGRTDVARRRRDEVRTLAADAKLAWYHVGMLDGLLGDAPAAADHLARSFARHEATCSLGAVDPSYDAVRTDPAFRRVLRSMGLPAG
jgi:TolB-like protein